TGHDAYSTHSWLTDPSRSPPNPPSPRDPSTSTLSGVTVWSSAPAGAPRNPPMVAASADPRVSVTTAVVASRVWSSISLSGRGTGPIGSTAERGWLHDWTARTGTPAAPAAAAAHRSAIRLWSEPSTPTTNSLIGTPSPRRA